jgi:hypothetical protein
VVAKSGGGVRLCGHERKTGEGEVRKELLPISPAAGGTDASPFLFLSLSLLFLFFVYSLSLYF